MCHESKFSPQIWISFRSVQTTSLSHEDVTVKSRFYWDGENPVLYIIGKRSEAKKIPLVFQMVASQLPSSPLLTHSPPLLKTPFKCLWSIPY